MACSSLNHELIRDNFPRFHFPYGNPALSPLGGCDASLRAFQEEFRRRSNNKTAANSATVAQEDMGDILKVKKKSFIFRGNRVLKRVFFFLFSQACGYHKFFKGVVFAAAGGEKVQKK